MTMLEVRLKDIQKSSHLPVMLTGAHLLKAERALTKLKADQPHPHDYSTQTNTQGKPWTDEDPSLLFAALGKEEPLTLTSTRQKFNLDI